MKILVACEEKWKDIKGYEDIYQVSSYGRVKSLSRLGARGYSLSERIMQPSPNSSGYLHVILTKDKQPTNHRVHRLVASNFLSTFTQEKQVDHIDNNKQNNRLENLRMVTQSQNQANTRRHKNKSSKFKGVMWFKPRGTWRCQLRKDNKTVFVRYFKTELAAAKAYDKKALELYGEYALTNKKQGLYKEV